MNSPTTIALGVHVDKKQTKTYMIHCTTFKSYTVYVNAPNEAAVSEYYCNQDDIPFDTGDEDGWELQGIEEVDDPYCDVTVDNKGNVVQEEQLPDEC
jgi:hypothetical protein